MVKSWFFTLFIISALVSLSISLGHEGASTVGSSDVVRSHFETEVSHLHISFLFIVVESITLTGYASRILLDGILFQDGLRAGREMVEMTMDYTEPGPNTNPRSGISNSPPSPPST
ncbi:hypothetical protein Cni_G11407 [Canna indica]|uniref:Transmembrane protein n=1 Tax=Canna indica TaxID=4628 RepID=A0AAQ3K613_9LILI|nr:hypothetical protein Cni_G11407 [Canna indica]